MHERACGCLLALTVAVSSILAVILSGCGCGKPVKGAGEIQDPTEVPGEGYLSEPTETPDRGDMTLSLSDAGNTDSIGRMTFFPNGDGSLAALAGTNQFTLYFENPFIQLNQGFITFYDSHTSTIYESIDIGNYGRCHVSPIDDAGMALTGWDRGSMVDIILSSPFLPGASFYVLIDEGCFTDGTYFSQGQLNASLIRFSVKEYGIDRMNGLARTYAQGARAVVDVLIGGECAYARIAGYDGELLAFSSPSFDATGELVVTFLKEGEPSFRVEFFNSQGTMIDSMTLGFSVIGSSATVRIA